MIGRFSSASADNSVRVWDAKTGQQVQICTGHFCFSVSWSHDDRFLASGSLDKHAYGTLRRASSYKFVRIHNFVNSVRWSHDDRFLASEVRQERARMGR